MIDTHEGYCTACTCILHGVVIKVYNSNIHHQVCMCYVLYFTGIDIHVFASTIEVI